MMMMIMMMIILVLSALSRKFKEILQVPEGLLRRRYTRIMQNFICCKIYKAEFAAARENIFLCYRLLCIMAAVKFEIYLIYMFYMAKFLM